MADPSTDQGGLLALWRPYRQFGKVLYWIQTRQVVASQELNGDRFVWEVWDVEKVRKIGQSADGQTYTRRETASNGAERFLKGLIE